MQLYALITGGSRGIGRAVSLKLASMGYNVLINYKGNKAAAEETALRASEFGVVAETIAFDVSKKEEIQQALGAWQENNKEKIIEVLVNNAGIRSDTLMMSMTD